MRNGSRTSEKGFSLLEILITLTIIALIATLVGPRLMSSLDRSKTTAARVQAKALKSAADAYRLDVGTYPSADEGLTALVQNTSGVGTWRGPYLDTALPLDPWGKPFLYLLPEQPDAAPRIGSYGADGAPGGEGSAADVFSDDVSTS